MRPLDPVVRGYLRPARGPISVMFTAGVLQAVLVIAQAFVVAGAVVAMVDDHALPRWVAALLIVTVLRAAATYLGDDAAGRAAARVGTTLRHGLLSRVEPERHLERSRAPGAVVVLATRGIHETEPYLTRYLPALALAVALPPLVVLAIATQDQLSALIVILTLPLIPLFAVLVGMRTRERAASQWQQLSLLAGHFLDVVKGLPTLVAFRRANRQIAAIRSITHRYRLATMSTLRLAFASSAVLELVATISVALVAVSVGLRLADGSLDLRTALTVLLLAPEAYWPIRRVGAEFHAAAQGGAAFAEVDKILTAPDDSRPSACVVPMLGAGVELSLDAATVCYPGRPEPALASLTTTLRGPGLVAVTGASGAGKSTLLLAVQGRLPLSAGRIALNGSQLDEIDPAWWSSQVSWSAQRPFFVHGTLAENLRLGRPVARDDELWSALRLVGLAFVVGALPEGLATAVAEDGLSLSSGERARLALARVVVAARPVVLLDEPTAHLDAESERVVMSTIRALAESSLVVAVTHRPALARAADQVIHLTGPRSRPSSGDSPTSAAGSARPRSAPVSEEPHGQPPQPSDDDPGPSPRRARLLVASSIVLGALASMCGVALTATAGWLIVKASTQPPVLVLMVAIVAVRTFGIARPVLRYAERLISHDAALRLLAEKRATVYAALVPLVPARLGRRRGDVLTSVVDDVEAWVDRRLRFAMPLATLGCLAVAIVAFELAVLPAAAAVNLALVLVPCSVAFWLVRAMVSRSDQEWVIARAELSDGITELAEGAAELTAWGATERMLARVDAKSDHVEALLARSSRRAAAGRALVLLGVGSGVCATLVVATGAVADGRLSGATAALLVLVPLAMAELVLPVADAAVADVRTRSALGRLDRLLTQAPAVTETSDPQALKPASRDLAVISVTAGWGQEPALEEVDLSVPEGARVGVVGPSGAGKSTLAALLVRFLDPDQGSVRYGDTDLRNCTLDDVRRDIGLLDDDPHIFSTTLAENVRLARPRASDADVEEALRSASLGPWLDSLPRGLHTWLGDGHSAVSGGERARIGLARVILADQPVIVLDEPTAHLDSQTAQEVMRSILVGAADRSVVLMTHRPEGLDLVHRVVSLGVDPGIDLERADALEPAIASVAAVAVPTGP